MNKPVIAEARDQVAHFAVAAFVIGILLHCPGTATAALAGLSCGLIREVTEGGNIFSRGSILDLTFWTLGGLAAWATL